MGSGTVQAQTRECIGVADMLPLPKVGRQRSGIRPSEAALGPFDSKLRRALPRRATESCFDQ